LSSVDSEGQTNSHEIIMSLRRLSSRTVLFQQHAAHALGVSPTDLKTIDILNETGPITAGELGHYTGLTTGTITALIDRMENAGFVKREKDPNDRRRVIIVPLSERREEVKAIYRSVSNATAELLSQYSEAELKLIQGFLTQIMGMYQVELQKMSK